MTAITWTIIYFFLLMVGIARGVFETGLDSDKFYREVDRWAVSCVCAAVITLTLCLMYLSGAFVGVTGYEGTMGWFTAWILLLPIEVVKMIYTSVVAQKYHRLILPALSLIALYNMGAFNNIANL
tara:strand:+ start:604 stop:978 length:375 start_codon:yes stop_codon:yes gene_type:complete